MGNPPPSTPSRGRGGGGNASLTDDIGRGRGRSDNYLTPAVLATNILIAYNMTQFNMLGRGFNEHD